MGVKYDVPVWTGTLIRIEGGDAVIQKDELYEKGRPVLGYFNNTYTFAVNDKNDPQPVVEGGRRRKTRGGRHRRRHSRKTRRSHK